jgi:soluble lytic murein transglycosylase-like protein
MTKLAAILLSLLLSSSVMAEDKLAKIRIGKFIEETYKVSVASSIVDTVMEVSKRKSIDPTLVFAIIAVESGFNPKAKNPSGARGLMQVLTPMHCQKFDRKQCVTQAHDIEKNIEVGTDILIDFNMNLHRYSGGAANYRQKVINKQRVFKKLYMENI